MFANLANELGHHPTIANAWPLRPAQVAGLVTAKEDEKKIDGPVIGALVCDGRGMVTLGKCHHFFFGWLELNDEYRCHILNLSNKFGEN